MEVQEQDIIAGCRRNDIAYQELLYKKYCTLFMVMCLRYVPGREDAEEVLNNAFLRIFRYIGKYSHAGSFEGWMKRIVVNCCLDFIQRSGRHGRIVSLHSAYGDGPGAGAAIESAASEDNLILEKHDRDYLLGLLHTLPEVPRLVFNLYVFESYNHREIGELLDMAERTSQAHLARARQLLAAALDKKKLMHKLQRV